MWSRHSRRERVVRLGEKVGNHTCEEAGEDEVPEIKFDIMRLVCPLIVVWVWVEELHVCM